MIRDFLSETYAQIKGSVYLSLNNNTLFRSFCHKTMKQLTFAR